MLKCTLFHEKLNKLEIFLSFSYYNFEDKIANFDKDIFNKNSFSSRNSGCSSNCQVKLGNLYKSCLFSTIKACFLFLSAVLFEEKCLETVKELRVLKIQKVKKLSLLVVMHWD